MRVCEDCEHAAFDAGGVYCKEFRESIFDSTVAEDCGMYEENGQSSDPPALTIVPALPWAEGVSREADRVLVMTLDVAYFGKPEQGEQLAEEITAFLQLKFGKTVQVRGKEVA